jgi:transcription initiation factor TFIID subunit TAF12
MSVPVLLRPESRPASAAKPMQNPARRRCRTRGREEVTVPFPRGVQREVLPVLHTQQPRQPAVLEHTRLWGSAQIGLGEHQCKRSRF